jgi:streptogramin lyase
MSHRSVRTLIGTLSVLAVCSCAAPAAKTGVTVDPKGNAAGTSTASSAKPVVVQTSQGRVLGLDGKPAAGVKVVAYLISQDGGGLISQDGGGLIAQGGGNYALFATEEQVQTTTGADGGFKLDLPAGRKANVEAVLDEDVKAIKLGVTSSEGLELKLDHVGSIAGKVLAPAGSTVTNLQGLSVYIPGTSYAARTDAGGAFTITGVPVGTFPLVAERDAFNVSRSGVVVTARSVTRVDDLQLVVQKAVIKRLEPAMLPKEGGKVVVKGESFGASTGAALQVNVGGILIAEPKAIDDQTIEFTLPKDAKGGDVLVTVGGQQSNVQRLDILNAVWLEAAGRALWTGSTQTLKAFVANTSWDEIPGVEVKWSVSGSAFTVDEDGVVTAVRAGSSELKAEVGGVSRTLVLTVFDKPFVTTLLGPARLPLGDVSDFDEDAAGGGPVGIALGPDGLVYLADTVTDGIGRIEPNGLLKAVAGKNLGKAIDQIWEENWPTEPTEPLASKLEFSLPAGLQNGPGDQALFDDPHGIAFDAEGNLYVADLNNRAIRKVAPDGTVSTVAGNGEPGDADGSLAAARFGEPVAIAVDAGGNLFVADRANNAVRKIDLTAGTVSTLAKNLDHPSDLAIDGAGKLFVLEEGAKAIRVITPAGEVSTLKGPALEAPSAIAVAKDGTLYVADGYVTIHAIAPGGEITVVHQSNNSEEGPPTDGPLDFARFGGISRMVVDAQGNLVFTDEGYRIVRKIVLKGP